MVNQQPALPSDHPAGERSIASPTSQNDTFPIDTAGGLYHVRWESDPKVSANGGMAHFAHFLQVSQVFDEWVKECPLSYGSNRAHDVRDILGTWILSTLNGHRRYAHITCLRNDRVNPELLGMNQVVSEDSVRRALRRIDPEAGRFWAQRHLVTTLAPLMAMPWILDVDVTVKPLYGFQEGSVVGYNPEKPGRPSHTLHTFLLAKARLILEVSVHPGDQHTSATTKTDLFNWLEKIPRELWPDCLRGDCGFGTEDMMAWPEAAGVDFLFKQRMTKNTKALVKELDLHPEGWVDAGQGWQGKESTLRLSTWTRTRRVVILRKLARQRYPRRKDVTLGKQELLDCAQPFLVEKDFEYQVLVTSLSDGIPQIAQLYRDRADAENVFDELKNHWSWGGFTSRKLSACQVATRMSAQVYNWWSIFVRMASPDHHREVVTSRPLLLNSIVRQTISGGQRMLTIVSNHAAATAVAQYFTALAARLRTFASNAEQWNPTQRWQALLRSIYASAFGLVVPDTG
jgi:hypothetical protein